MYIKDLFEAYTATEGQDIIQNVSNFLEWREGIIPEVRELRNRYMAELSAHRETVKADNDAKRAHNADAKQTKAATGEKPDKYEGLTKEERRTPNFYSQPLENRIARYGRVGIAFISSAEGGEYCGRTELPGLGSFNCYNGMYSALSYSGSPGQFTLLNSNAFSVLFHEWWHSTQSVFDDQKIPHGKLIHEIEAVVATSLAKFVATMLQQGNGNAAGFMKKRGFRDDYGHFVREFLPDRLSFVKNILSHTGGGSDPGAYITQDKGRAMAIHKMFFAYFRAFYRGEYHEGMNFPADYWKDREGRTRGKH